MFSRLALSDLAMQVGGYTDLKPWRMGVAPGERLPAWDKATIAPASERRDEA